MWWIMFIVLIAIIGLIYLFLPLIKKSVEKSKAKSQDKKTLKESIKQDKKNQKEQKKLDKQQAKEEAQEKANEPIKEDPDLKIEENNLDIDGFFNADFNAKKQENLSSEGLNSEYDNIFDKLFSNDRPSSNMQNATDNQSFDAVRESEIKDYLNDDEFSSNQTSDIGKMIAELPPEIKALLLSDALDRKDY